MQMKEEYNDIDGLITSYLSGNLDKASFSELQKWTMESEANRIYVRNKLELWFSSGVSGSVEPFDEDAAFTLFQQRAAIFPKKEKPAKRSFSWKMLYRVAAVLLVLLVPFATYYQGKHTVKQDFSDIVVEASLGTHTKLNLPDGSLVWLNAGSKVTYSQGFGVDDRKLTLEGEGYFEVAHNEKVPFEVCTKEVNLRVLGTKFNFKNYSNDEEVMISLVEGKVALQNGIKAMEELYLEPNERMVLNKLTGEMVKSKANVEYANIWRDNKLFFDEELLEDIAKKLMRSYDVRIEVADSLRDRRFYGDFMINKNTIEEVLETIASTSRMNYRYENGKYILY